MIKINLLPVPKARRVEGLIIQAVLGISALVAVAVGCYFVTMSKRGSIDSINLEIVNRQRMIDELQAQVGKVEGFKQQAQNLEQQLNVIRGLEKGRSGPVKLLDEMTDLIPRRVWITNYKEQDKKVTIEGVGENGPAIADFMESLKTAKYFANVQLTTMTLAEQSGSKLQKFTLTMQVKYDI
jgi:type IV pilus assembly protein PilN